MIEQKILQYLLLFWFCIGGLVSNIEQKPKIKPVFVSESTLNITDFKKEIKLSSRGSDIDREKERAINAINKFLKNKLKDKGSVIYDNCKKQEPEVSARLMTSIILLEVGPQCDSDVLKYADNVGGLNWFEDCGYPKYGRWYIDFSNDGGIDKSIEMKARILSRYIREGRTDIVSIGLKYAPPDDSRNGIGGMDNTEWADNVQAYFDMITNEYEKTE